MVQKSLWLKAPFGGLQITQEDETIIRIERVDQPKHGKDSGTSPLLAEAERQLTAYFAGERRQFDFPIELRGSAFDQRVWEKLLTVPFGEWKSYGEIAKEIGKPGAARAVGGAVGRNPLLIVVPCHRILRKDGGIGGFSAGIDAKKTLIAIEGICYSPGIA